MGMYTPYIFNYSELNPSYDAKGTDVWGNYRATDPAVSCAVDSPLTNQEFPYVDQSNPIAQNEAIKAWSLESIDLPSGGHLQIDYESDDYRYVQDKEVMEMFKVVGTGNGTFSDLGNDLLYSGTSPKEYLYIELNENISDNSAISNKLEYFQNKYIRNLASETVYFRFLLNMTKPGGATSGRADDDFDYVTGYLELGNTSSITLFRNGGTQYAAIPIKTVPQGDGIATASVNPIAKAGWGFGRKNLHRKVYSDNGEEDITDVKAIVLEVINSIPAILEIFKSPFGLLRSNNIARRFIKGKSWIRLMHPSTKKLGGGCRVAAVKLHDNWDVMTAHDGDDNYKQFYGQEYNYESEEGVSSGVATYEPLGSKENPLVQPFYDRNNPGLLLAPGDQKYVEKPMGESFYPSPKVTYGKVTVKNLQRERIINNGTDDEQTLVVKKHATGRVTTTFFTSKDYPTITDYTTMIPHNDKSDFLSGLLNLDVKNHLTLSQGYTIHTNDMNGKMSGQRVYAEGQTQFISGVDYNYEDLENQGAPDYNKNEGKLNNTVTTIDAEGVIADKLVGVDYDVVNDFRRSKTVSEIVGLKFNTAGSFYGPFFVVIPVGLPRYSRHENQIKTAVTTKVIHTSGILKEKIAYDVGAQVSTKNLAWDAGTGEVLLTETVNEYGDHYFNLNTPAYWAYEGMDQAAINLGLSANFTTSGDYFNFSEAKKYLIEGDELWLQSAYRGLKAWVIEVNDNSFKLIDRNGLKVSATELLSEGVFKVIRSGHRNMQSASMASITSTKNPLETIDANGDVVVIDRIDGDTFRAEDGEWNKFRIVNASGVEYADEWAAQCECKLPRMQYDEYGNIDFDYTLTEMTNDDDLAYNPYRYNIKGDWRAKKSYAYLTGRNFTDDPTPRNTGFFMNFRPLYVYNDAPGVKQWEIDELVIDQSLPDKKWTFASEVTKYNPFGFEVENKDALKRYSSAQYGYNNTFPIAVGSNTQYKELGFDGFEDYDFSECDDTSHFNFQDNITDNIITITTEESHTGRSSLKVAPNTTATMSKQLLDCNAIPEQVATGSVESKTKK